MGLYPEVLALVKKVAAEKEGTSACRWYSLGSETPVVKEAYRKTVAFYSAEWRLIIACSRDDMEPVKQDGAIENLGFFFRAGHYFYGVCNGVIVTCYVMGYAICDR